MDPVVGVTTDEVSGTAKLATRVNPRTTDLNAVLPGNDTREVGDRRGARDIRPDVVTCDAGSRRFGQDVYSVAGIPTDQIARTR